VFESYLDRGKKRSLRSRALTLALSVMLHGGGVGLLIFISLFHVEELPEPSVTVTFFSVAPPPPPPPPKAPAVTKPKKTRRPRRIKPKPMDVQPPDKPPPPKKDKEPEPEPEPAGGEPEGVQGGVEGGVPGGVPQPRAKPRPKKEEPKKPVFVRRQVVEKLKISGTMPEYLPAARMAKVQGVVIVKLCLKADGTADLSRTKILKGLEALNEEIMSKVRTWRYKPYLVNGEATPVCFPVKFVFRFQ